MAQFDTMPLVAGHNNQASVAVTVRPGDGSPLFRKHLAGEIANSFGPFSFCVYAFPEFLWSLWIHYINVVLGLCSLSFYAYSSLFPPAWVFHISQKLHLPPWMNHAIPAVVVGIVGCGSLRVALCRSILFNDDLRHILDDTEFLEDVQSSSSDTRSCWGNFPQKNGVAFLFAAGGIVGMRVIFPDDFVSIITFMIPWIGVAVTGSIQPTFVLSQMIRLAGWRVEAICKKLSPSLADQMQPDSNTNERLEDIAFWVKLTKEHREMDRHLETLFSFEHGGKLLLTDLFLRISFLAAFILAAVGVQDARTITWAVSGATFIAVTILDALYPLAQITSLCQDKAPKTRSIIRLAVEFVNHEDMSSETQAAQARFLQYVCNAPAGVEVPVVGLVTLKAIMGYTQVVLTVAPVALTYLLKALGRE